LLVYKIWICWSWNCYHLKDFRQVLILPDLIRVNKLVIPGGIPFLGWIYCPWTGNSRRKTHSYGGFHVYELVIPGRFTIYPVEGECWQSADEILPVDSSSLSWWFPAESLFLLWRASVGSPRSKNPLDGNNSRIPYSEGSLPRKHNFLKLKHENVIKMKNKPHLALLWPSNLSNEIKKRYQNLYPFKLWRRFIATFWKLKDSVLHREPPCLYYCGC
jgi:hypothetical protein